MWRHTETKSIPQSSLSRSCPPPASCITSINGWSYFGLLCFSSRKTVLSAQEDKRPYCNSLDRFHTVCLGKQMKNLQVTYFICSNHKFKSVRVCTIKMCYISAIKHQLKFITDKTETIYHLKSNKLIFSKEKREVGKRSNHDCLNINLKQTVTLYCFMNSMLI